MSKRGSVDRGLGVCGSATHERNIAYGVVAARTVSYVQVISLLTGHAAGLTLAHDRALTIYEAARPQSWMLTIMVGFTSLGLYLLFAANR